jgi:hypothetical protein
VATALLLLLAAAPALAGPPRRSLEILSPVYTVEGIYRSMGGPQETRALRVLEGRAPELLWITGYRADMVAADGVTPVSREFMCHSNLDVDMAVHRRRMGWLKSPSDRLFTLSQGQQEIRFPDGFGIPLWSDEALSLTTQVLNLNPQPAAVEVRHRVTLEFVFDRDLEAPLRPLFLVGANGFVALDGGAPGRHYGIAQPDPATHGSGCMVGANAGTHTYEDPFGRLFTGHWTVPPGRQVNRTPVSAFMDLPFDTTVHYIAVHLHPFAESLELRDLTTGEVVFASRAENATDRVGLARVEHFASETGIALFKGHQYELVSVYDNPTDAEQDSMAVMFLYLLDRETEIAPRGREGDGPRPGRR